MLDCGHEPSEHGEHTTGYGVNTDGQKICWECCAVTDRLSMLKTGKATLYLVGKAIHGLAEKDKLEVTNWPGTLRFPVYYSHNGRHNIARTRIDVWFNGPNGKKWWGVTYGDFTQIIHCKEVHT